MGKNVFYIGSNLYILELIAHDESFVTQVFIFSYTNSIIYMELLIKFYFPILNFITDVKT